jgi:adenine/guanine phosphoribosyltransferase-like PRPP-binding protein
MSYYYNQGYLEGEGIAKTVKACKALIKRKGIDFDTIAVRGHSGMLMGAPLAMQTKKKLIFIRKKGDKSHSGNTVEGWGRKQKILIVDDFICSGSTIKAAYKAIIENCDDCEVVGILLYASGNNRSGDFTLNKKKIPLYKIAFKEHEDLEG